MVKYAVSLHSVVPVRAEASEAAEQQTQMLFAETCDVIQELPRWTEVILHGDGQRGWVDAKMITPLTPKEYEELVQIKKNESMARVSVPLAYAVSTQNGQTFPLTAGTELTNYKDGIFQILGASLRIDPTMVTEHPFVMSQEKLLQVVRFFLNIPYLWGGKNAMGMDCSGFTQVIMSLFGHQLPRNASQQAQVGQIVNPIPDAVAAGDLAFFDHADQDSQRTNISHVGIIIDHERIIHCSGRVKVERWDTNGILSMESANNDHPQGVYTHHLNCIRRL